MINTTEFWEKLVVLCVQRGEDIETALSTANAALKAHPEALAVKPAARRIFTAPEKLIAGRYRIISILGCDDAPAHAVGDIVTFSSEGADLESAPDEVGGFDCYFVNASNGGIPAVAPGTWATALELLDKGPIL